MDEEESFELPDGSRAIFDENFHPLTHSIWRCDHRLGRLHHLNILRKYVWGFERRWWAFPIKRLKCLLRRHDLGQRAASHTPVTYTFVGCSWCRYVKPGTRRVIEPSEAKWEAWHELKAQDCARRGLDLEAWYQEEAEWCSHEFVEEPSWGTIRCKRCRKYLIGGRKV
jgi:hypothetical protein